jgi:hypothetical protein
MVPKWCIHACYIFAKLIQIYQLHKYKGDKWRKMKKIVENKATRFACVLEPIIAYFGCVLKQIFSYFGCVLKQITAKIFA